MAIEKPMNSRVLLKNDIEANWMKAVNFIPKLGEAIIYNAELDGQEPVFDGQAVRPPIKYQRIKIGDGVTNVNDLPFITDKLHELVGDIPVSEQIAAAIQDEIYVQEEEPLEAPDGSLWVDLDEEIEDTSIEVDASLSIEGAAADAKVVGDRLALIEEELDKPQIAIDATLSQAGAAADAKAVGDALATKQPLGNYVKAVNGNTPDENGNVAVEFEGVTSWNDLTDKPFQYETVYYEWDEDTEYETIVPVGTEGDNVIVSSYAKISDDVPSKDFLIGKYLEITQRSSGETASLQITSNLIEEDEGAYQVALWLVFVTADSYDMGAANPLTRGVWCVHGAEDNPMTLSALSIYDPAVQLDESVIPDTIARVEDIPSTFYATVVYNPDTSGATSDKAFDEINEAYLSDTTVYVKLKESTELGNDVLILYLTQYEEDLIEFSSVVNNEQVYNVSFTATGDIAVDVRELGSGTPSDPSIEVDTTLTKAGAAADAKAVGDALAEKQPIGNYVKTINNRAPDENGNINVEGAGIDENIVLITVEDIDEICGAVIQIATNDEVKF